MNYKSIIKRQSSIIAISVIAMCLVLIGTSYSIFMKVDKSTSDQIVETGTLSVNYVNGTTITSSLVPTSDTNIASLPSYTFTVTNNGTLPMSYYVTIYTDTTNTPASGKNYVSNEYLRVSLDGNVLGTITDLEVFDKTVSDPLQKKYILSNNEVVKSAGTQNQDTKTHTVKVWLDEYAPDDLVGDKVSLKVDVVGVAEGDNIVVTYNYDTSLITLTESSKSIKGYTSLGSLPSAIKNGTTLDAYDTSSCPYIEGWYLNSNYTGQKISKDTIFTSNTNIYAKIKTTC